MHEDGSNHNRVHFGPQHRAESLHFAPARLAARFVYAPSMQATELDLTVLDMNSPEHQQQVRRALELLPGIGAVRIIQRGAWVLHDPEIITSEQICRSLHQSGFRAGVFQDALGHEDRSSL